MWFWIFLTPRIFTDGQMNGEFDPVASFSRRSHTPILTLLLLSAKSPGSWAGRQRERL